jgi:hypothetical protein
VEEQKRGLELLKSLIVELLQEKINQLEELAVDLESCRNTDDLNEVLGNICEEFQNCITCPLFSLCRPKCKTSEQIKVTSGWIRVPKICRVCPLLIHCLFSVTDD